MKNININKVILVKNRFMQHILNKITNKMYFFDFIFADLSLIFNIIDLIFLYKLAINSIKINQKVYGIQ